MIELTIPDIAPSANHFYAGMNVHARRKLAHRWHGIVIISVKSQKIKRIAEYPVDVTVYCNFGKGKRMLDADNLFPTIKLILDGLILAGILVDDSPKYIRSVRLIPERNRGKSSHSRVVIESITKQQETKTA